ncbi:hypothetical protein M3234_15810 [Neobacillus niacini]|nr:hypothetical protein [Neobacillus niacini]
MSNNRYKYSQEDVQFQTYLIKNKMISDQLDEIREDLDFAIRLIKRA